MEKKQQKATTDSLPICSECYENLVNFISETIENTSDFNLFTNYQNLIKHIDKKHQDFYEDLSLQHDEKILEFHNFFQKIVSTILEQYKGKKLKTLKLSVKGILGDNLEELKKI